MLRVLSIAIAIALGLVVLYFSWIPDPAMGKIHWMPRAIGHWADRHGRLRTGVPFLPLGILLGLYLTRKRAILKWWLLVWLGLTSFVSAAEVGQLFIPRRVFDLRDIFWGSMGSAVGLLFVGTLWHIYRRTLGKLRS
ncbi:VanZ family protein [Luteolibacter pohnpeiensis]|uniref:VanZ family protein n=1 Tax=Luteolibacter pohnpeiensis TaxID=454153 RepID=A0A934VWI4_9BACT|nr:VanZ family protein [Luteolibacter pohnpeiensis]MBK1882848.1 VanZ family protein [Luteolibacter pohnpeiensis]